jgi:hypothetical protein
MRSLLVLAPSIGNRREAERPWSAAVPPRSLPDLSAATNAGHAGKMWSETTLERTLPLSVRLCTLIGCDSP